MPGGRPARTRPIADATRSRISDQGAGCCWPVALEPKPRATPLHDVAVYLKSCSFRSLVDLPWASGSFRAGDYCILAAPTVESWSRKPTPPALWFRLFGACVVRKSYSPNPHARITYTKETEGDDFGSRSERLRDGGGSPCTPSEARLGPSLGSPGRCLRLRPA